MKLSTTFEETKSSQNIFVFIILPVNINKYDMFVISLHGESYSTDEQGNN